MTRIIGKDKNSGYHNKNNDKNNNYNNSTGTQMIIKTQAESK